MIDTLLVALLALGLGWPIGRYMSRVMRGGPAPLDAVFGPVERGIYRVLGVDASAGMRAPQYIAAFVATNAMLLVLVGGVFMTQAWLPWNPDAIPNMRWDVALHTVVSFLTNTNQQHYSGQAQLSYLSQGVAIVGLQVVTPMMGLALLVAVLRALLGGRQAMHEGAAPAATAGSEPDVGNYWADVTRATLRIMLPLCLAWTLLLAAQGVPSTFSAGPTVTPVDASAGMGEQKIPLGPVAAMVAAKQLGTNGGGWYGPNSTVALENPTPLSNLFETLAIVLLPVSICFMLTPFTRRRRFTGFVLGTMLAMSVASVAAGMWFESHGVAGPVASVMEGKEVRFGVDDSALWAMLTTQTSNGSVNAMHDSFAPLTGLVTLANMLINAIWGGVGCGLLQFLVYVLLAVFLAGLMTGRTPELFGRKIEAAEVRWLALPVLLQPIAVLGFTAWTLAWPAVTGNSNPGFHGISQVFYEYTSAFANNGSGFEGLGDGTVWWNLTCTLVLMLGRYPALIVPLIVAASLGRKRHAPEGPGSLAVETPTFALTTIAVIVILTLLQFMPALVLGPVAEHLALTQSRGAP